MENEYVFGNLPISKISMVRERVYKNSRETCEYISGYEKKTSIIKVKCLIHENEFDLKYENIRHDNKPYYPCQICQKEQKQLRYESVRQEVECAYCKKKFLKQKTHLIKSRSGLFFCCREHKDLAQRLDSGENFDAMRPDHYGTGFSNYRDLAFSTYEPTCACCDWHDDIRILEVHHIDSNRENGDISNLIILCPNCHRKITLGYYILDLENKKLIPN